MRPSATDKKSFSMANWPDLGMEFLHIGHCRFLFLVEDLGCPLQELFLPLRDLGGMDLEALGQFHQGLFSLDGLQGHFALNTAPWFLLGLLLMVLLSFPIESLV